MSARDVAARLPDIAALRDLCRSMAMVEAILNPDNEYRRHGYDARWSGARELAWMDNGAGDEYSVVFSAAGAYVRGFDHHSPMSPFVAEPRPWPGVLDSVPEVFHDWVREPSFADEDGLPRVTACLWREPGDDRWRTGDVDFDGTDEVPDGADYLFGLLIDGTPEGYRDWARDYYETPVDLDAVRHVYALRPLTPGVVAALNPEVTPAGLENAVTAIGYPPADTP
ncbi:hypothetical protein ABZ816_15295 [Actinosynnema sp. NPDC047251]|uniref:Uncharacterized protein n=1 Tax=Saccharothrix espanaensis (strain ATCC 51144 / DSM 44229 / JCM 9112 / NBRC 15066 / NRRL 15764) TaxID=1179773 RepID=K0JQJ1_SACES|nr:hypothetical protein [Saccharothrix espanaensis]CCH29615.1 hypothetical protein BN6_22950 [Saccharothrix espanaensis DSM 44229]